MHNVNSYRSNSFEADQGTNRSNRIISSTDQSISACGQAAIATQRSMSLEPGLLSNHRITNLIVSSRNGELIRAPSSASTLLSPMAQSRQTTLSPILTQRTNSGSSGTSASTPKASRGRVHFPTEIDEPHSPHSSASGSPRTPSSPSNSSSSGSAPDLATLNSGDWSGSDTDVARQGSLDNQLSFDAKDFTKAPPTPNSPRENAPFNPFASIRRGGLTNARMTDTSSFKPSTLHRTTTARELAENQALDKPNLQKLEALKAKAKGYLFNWSQHDSTMSIAKLGEKLARIVESQIPPFEWQTLDRKKNVNIYHLTTVLRDASSTTDELKKKLDTLSAEKGRQIGWHEAKESFSTTDGDRFDKARESIVQAILELSLGLTKLTTGKECISRDVGSKGYKSDKDISFAPQMQGSSSGKQPAKDFTFSAAKPIVDALLHHYLKKSPEQIFDTECYLQHSGELLHTNALLVATIDKPHLGFAQRAFMEGQVQAACFKCLLASGSDKTSASWKSYKKEMLDGCSSSDLKLSVAKILKSTEKFADMQIKLLDAQLGSKDQRSELNDFTCKDRLIYRIYSAKIGPLQSLVDKLNIELDRARTEGNTPRVESIEREMMTHQLEQAQWATIADSFTKEGYLTQGAYRKVVVNDGGQTQRSLLDQARLAKAEGDWDRAETLEQKAGEVFSSSLLSEVTSMLENFSFFHVNTSASAALAASSPKTEPIADELKKVMVAQSKYALRTIEGAATYYGMELTNLTRQLKTSSGATRLEQQGKFDQLLNCQKEIEELKKPWSDLYDLKRKSTISFAVYQEQMTSALMQLGIEDPNSKITDLIREIESDADEKNATLVEKYDRIILAIANESNGRLIGTRDGERPCQLELAIEGEPTASERDALLQMQTWTMALAEFDGKKMGEVLQQITPIDLDTEIPSSWEKLGLDTRGKIFEDCERAVSDQHNLNSVEILQDLRSNLAKAVAECNAKIVHNYALFSGDASTESKSHEALVVSLLEADELPQSQILPNAPMGAMIF